MQNESRPALSHLSYLINIGIFTAGLLMGAGLFKGVSIWLAPHPQNTASTETRACGLPTPSQSAWFKIQGKEMGLSDLDLTTRRQIYNIQQQAHTEIKNIIQEFGLRYYLTMKDPHKKSQYEKEGVLPSLQDLIDTPEPDEQLIREFYEVNKDKLKGRSYQDVHQQLKQYLKSTLSNGQIQQYLAELTENYQFEILLQNPEEPLLELEFVKHYPAIGKKNAPHHLFVFTSPFCPYCRQSAQEVSDLPERLPEVKVTSILMSNINENQLEFYLSKGAWCMAKYGTAPQYKDYILASYQLPPTLQFEKTVNPKVEHTNTVLDIVSKILPKDQIQTVQNCIDSPESSEALRAGIREFQDKSGPNYVPAFLLNGQSFALENNTPLHKTVSKHLKKGAQTASSTRSADSLNQP